jgi:predicted phage-related endonuclease
MPVPDDAEQSEPAYWGQVLEPVVRGHYAIQSNRLVVVPTESIVLDGWLRCTPDGISLPVPRGWGATVCSKNIDSFDVMDEATEAVENARRFGAAGLVQVKTCSAWLEDDWQGSVPPKYEVQCRVEMAVTDLPWCDLVCLCGGQRYLGPFRIERDLEIEQQLLGSLRKFWDMVQAGVEPTVDHTDAWRLHASEKMERARPVTVTADLELTAELRAWRAARLARKRAERDEDRSKNALLLRLSAAGATRIDAAELGRVTAFKANKNHPTWTLKMPTSWKDDE